MESRLEEMQRLSDKLTQDVTRHQRQTKRIKPLQLIAALVSIGIMFGIVGAVAKLTYRAIVGLVTGGL